MGTEERIILKSTNKPQVESVQALTVWFLRVFDISEEENSMEAQLFKSIASTSLSGDGVTSKELNITIKMPRSTLIYHLNRFINSGLVVRKGRRYYLRSSDMESTIEELQADMLREFSRMMQFAERFDQILMGDISGRRQKKPKNR